MANIGSLTADLRLESAAFIRDMGRAQRAVASNTAAMRKDMRRIETASRNVGRQLSQMRGAAVALAGALAVRQFSQFAKSAIETGDALAKQSRQLQISSDAFQRFRIEGELAGVSTQKLESGLGALTKRIGEAQAGTGTLAEFLKKSNTELLNSVSSARSTEEAMQLMLRAIRDSGNAFERQALSAAAFGRQAGQAMVLLADNIGRLSAEQIRLRTLSAETLKASEELSDQVGNLQGAFQAGFNTAIIEGLTGAVSDSVEAMREAREIGEEFGRAVGTAMRGVAAAGKFVARHMREIAIAIGAIIALKAAAMFISLGIAIVQFTRAVTLAAKGMVLLDAIMSRTVLGAVAKLAIAVGAAAATWEAFGKEATAAANAIDDAAKDLAGNLGGASKEATAAAKAVEKLTDEQNELTSQTLALIVAHKKSDAEFKKLKKEYDLLNEAARQGVDVATEQGRAWLEAARAARDLQDELAGLIRKREEDTKATEEQIKQQQELMQEPFKNAIRGIQDSFTDMFEDVFSGGVDSFSKLASTVKRIFIRMAAELASLNLMRAVFGGASAPTAGASGASGGGIGQFSNFVPTSLFSGGGSGVFSNLFSGNFSAAFSAIPVWGWMAAAATAVKQFTATNERGTLKGTIDSLLLPSIDQVLENPAAAAFNVFATPLDVIGLNPFRSKPSVGPAGGATFRVDPGRMAQFAGSGGDNGFDPSGIASTVRSVVTDINTLLERLGGTGFGRSLLLNLESFASQGGIRTGLHLRPGGSSDPSGFRNTTFGEDAEAAIADLVIKAFKFGDPQGIAPEIAAAIRNTSAKTLEAFVSDLEFAQSIAGVTTQVSAFDAAMQSVADRFGEITDRARSLGIATESLVAAQKREEAAVRLQFRAPFIGAAEQIAGFLRGTEGQFASPADQIRMAQAQFGELIGRVRGGEIGLTQPLLQTAQSLIGFGRSQFASGADFQGIDRFVRSQLASVGETLTSEDFFDAQVEATRQQTEVISGGSSLADLEVAIEGLRDEFRAVRREMEARAA